MDLALIAFRAFVQNGFEAADSVSMDDRQSCKTFVQGFFFSGLYDIMKKKKKK